MWRAVHWCSEMAVFTCLLWPFSSSFPKSLFFPALHLPQWFEFEESLFVCMSSCGCTCKPQSYEEMEEQFCCIKVVQVFC